jgi:sialidase-1
MKSIKIQILSIALLFPLFALAQEQQKQGSDRSTAVVVRSSGQDGISTYRIPGLATANDGTLIAVYDVRHDSPRDLQGNIDIGISRSLDKGKSWQPMQIILDKGKWAGLPEKFNGISDACILVDRSRGTIYVAALWMHGVLDDKGRWIEELTEDNITWNHQWRGRGSQPGVGEKETAQFLLTKSFDNGLTWDEPVNLTAMVKKKEWWLFAPAPGAGITLKNGTLVFPAQGRDEHGKPFSTILFSKDHGSSWQAGKPALAEQTTENMAVEMSDGNLMLNMRANSNRNNLSDRNGRAVAITRDLGQTWEEHPTSHRALIEPTCMASIIRHDYRDKHKKKSLLIFCNPAMKNSRSNLTIKVSKDEGMHWTPKLVLEQEKGRGYSCLTSIDEESVGVLYENSKAELIFERIFLKDL